MWIGERITEKGIGNGISIVLTINIISRIPSDLTKLYEQYMAGKTIPKATLAAVIIAAIIIALVVFVVILTECRETYSSSVFKENSGKKTGWWTIHHYSYEG